MRRTMREAYIQASSFLQERAGNRDLQDPDRVAGWMLEHLLGLSRSELFLRWDEPFPEERADELQRWLERKAAGEPVQYIIGETEFYGLRFKVNQDVLIPRPETELLVEEILRQGTKRWGPEGVPKVADIGTGSGAIPVSLSVKRPLWRLAAVDISSAALATAIDNAALHRVQDRIEWLQGDLLSPLIDSGARLDVVVSNPPYIPTGELAGLQREVRFEPMNALDGGVDGLVLYRRLIEQLRLLPQMPELVGLEVGIGQDEDVAALLREKGGYDRIWIVKDLQGIGRHVLASNF